MMPDFLKDRIRLEIKAADTKTGEIEGMGSIFGEEDSYGDVIEKGAFEETLASGRSVKMLWQHDTRRVIGVWDKLEETEEGLYAKGRISNEISDGKDALAAARMGAVDGLSIGFNIPPGGARFDEETEIRMISKIDLWELSLVTFPAAANARISGIKSMGFDEIDALDEKGIERALREAGLSRDGAKAMLHRHAKLIRAREAQGLKEAIAADKAKADLRRILLG
jgi:HK97 family phage prohead protease